MSFTLILLDVENGGFRLSYNEIAGALDVSAFRFADSGVAIELVGIDFDAPVHQVHSPAPDRFETRRRSRLAGPYIETSLMEGTFDFAAIDIALRQRAWAMRAHIAEDEIVALQDEHCIRNAVALAAHRYIG